jgi:DNA mismatch endonuclease (patch repair protein)
VVLSRSENMSHIRSANTEPELIVRRALHRAGFRYRLHVRTPGGKADLVIKSKRFALFIDGCFWHGCPEHYVRPRSNSDFWDKKLRANVDRDRRQTLALLDDGWTILRVWEHEVREAPLDVIDRVMRSLAAPHKPTGGWRVVRVRSTGNGAEEVRSQEDLLTPSRTRYVVRVRTTAKTGRVRGAVRKMSETPCVMGADETQARRRSGRNGSA